MIQTPLTIHLLVKNNEKTIEETLSSLTALNASILVGDLGCKDKTIDICNSFNVEIIKLSLNNDFSQARNQMNYQSKTMWNLYLNPWEVLINGHEIVKDCISGPVVNYKLKIIQQDIITKQIRLWNKKTNVEFINPVFEILEGDSKDLEVYVSTNAVNEINFDLLEKWQQKEPLANKPIYYIAYYHLSKNNWDSFLNFAETYLHKEKKDIVSVYMMNYYCSMVNCYIKKDYQSAIKQLLLCIAKCPALAEFWCLLGDIYYEIKDYNKAKSFYLNAIVLGEKRLKTDDFPIEVSKYKNYPNKMIQACDNLNKSIVFYAKENN